MKFLAPILILSCLALSGCSDGSPSNSEVEKAVEEMYDERNQPTKSIDVQECKPSKKEGKYLCAVTIVFDSEEPMALTMPHILEKVNGKWFASGGRRRYY